MGRSGAPQDLVAQMQRMQEQIRQLRMKRPQGFEPVQAQIHIPAASFGAGWATSDPLSTISGLTARYYKDRGRVYLSGLVTFTGPGDRDRPLINTPAGYVPKFLANTPIHTDDDNTASATRGKRWIGEFLPQTALWLTLDIHPDFAAAPNNGFPPDGTYLILDGLSYTHA